MKEIIAGKYKKSNDGFSLIEVIVAIAIIGIITVSFLSIFSTSFKFITLAGQKSNAVNEVVKQLESDMITGNKSDIDSITIKLSFGTIDVEVEGHDLEKIQPYNHGTGSVGIKSFFPNNSVLAAVPESTSTAPLAINVIVLEMSIGGTFTIEANKPVSWSSVSSPSGSIVIDSVTGIITANATGTATITATAGTETKTCAVVVMDRKLGTVRGGSYVKNSGGTYIKLTGNNGRVLNISVESSSARWTSSIDVPYNNEVVNDDWSDAIRQVASKQYWLKDDLGSNKSACIDTSGVVSSANQNNYNYIRKVISLDPTKKVLSGTGSSIDPYIIEN